MSDEPKVSHWYIVADTKACVLMVIIEVSVPCPAELITYEEIRIHEELVVFIACKMEECNITRDRKRRPYTVFLKTYTRCYFHLHFPVVDFLRFTIQQFYIVILIAELSIVRNIHS